MNAPAAPLIARLRAEIASLRQQLAAAIASWDEERERAQREGMRVVALQEQLAAAEIASLREEAHVQKQEAERYLELLAAAEQRNTDMMKMGDRLMAERDAAEEYTVTRKYFDNALQAAEEKGARLALDAVCLLLKYADTRADPTSILEEIDALSIESILKGKPPEGAGHD
jgi:chromosome segregation ATPase